MSYEREASSDNYGSAITSRGNGWMTLSELAELSKNDDTESKHHSPKASQMDPKTAAMKKQMMTTTMYGLENKLAAVADQRRTDLKAMMTAARQRPKSLGKSTTGGNQEEKKESDLTTNLAAKLEAEQAVLNAEKKEERSTSHSRMPSISLTVLKSAQDYEESQRKASSSAHSITASSTDKSNQDNVEHKVAEQSMEKQGSFVKIPEPVRRASNSSITSESKTSSSQQMVASPSQTPERRASATFTSGDLPFRRRQSNPKNASNADISAADATLSTVKVEEEKASPAAAATGITPAIKKTSSGTPSEDRRVVIVESVEEVMVYNDDDDDDFESKASGEEQAEEDEREDEELRRASTVALRGAVGRSSFIADSIREEEGESEEESKEDRRGSVIMVPVVGETTSAPSLLAASFSRDESADRRGSVITVPVVGEPTSAPDVSMLSKKPSKPKVVEEQVDRRGSVITVPVVGEPTSAPDVSMLSKKPSKPKVVEEQVDRRGSVITVPVVGEPTSVPDVALLNKKPSKPKVVEEQVDRRGSVITVPVMGEKTSAAPDIFSAKQEEEVDRRGSVITVPVVGKKTSAPNIFTENDRRRSVVTVPIVGEPTAAPQPPSDDTSIGSTRKVNSSAQLKQPPTELEKKLSMREESTSSAEGTGTGKKKRASVILIDESPMEVVLHEEADLGSGVLNIGVHQVEAVENDDLMVEAVAVSVYDDQNEHEEQIAEATFVSSSSPPRANERRSSYLSEMASQSALPPLSPSPSHARKPSGTEERRSSFFGLMRRKSDAGKREEQVVVSAGTATSGTSAAPQDRRFSLSTSVADSEMLGGGASRRGSSVSSMTMDSYAESPLMVYRKPSLNSFASGQRRPSLVKRAAGEDSDRSLSPMAAPGSGDYDKQSEDDRLSTRDDSGYATPLEEAAPEEEQQDDQPPNAVVTGEKPQEQPSQQPPVTGERRRSSILNGLRRKSQTADPLIVTREMSEEEKQHTMAQQAKKETQDILRRIQNITAKTAELASLESELARIEKERLATRDNIQHELDEILREQEDVEAQLEILKMRRKALQLKAGELDATLDQQENQVKKAGEERELARLALDQAQKDKETLLGRYAEVQKQYPEKIKPISDREMVLESPVKSRRLTFPLPVHAPSVAPPLVLRGLFQLKKDPSIDKVAGPNRVSATTREVLLKVPDVTPRPAGKQGNPDHAADGGLPRPPTVRRKDGMMPIMDPARATVMSELQKTGGAVNLKKVSAPEMTSPRESRGPSLVMSRLAHSMNFRREALEASDDEGEDEWK